MIKYRKLEAGEVTKPGDYVTIGATESTGYRPFNGVLGLDSGDFSYPIYRNAVEQCYMRVVDFDDNNPLTVTMEEAKGILVAMAENLLENGEAEKYSFEVTQMTAEEYKLLPIFTGF